MRRKMRYQRVVAAAITTVMLLLTGCGASDGYAADTAYGGMAYAPANSMTQGAAFGSFGDVEEVYYDSDMGFTASDYKSDEAGGSGSYNAPAEVTQDASQTQAYLDERKLIKTVDLSVETKEYDVFMQDVQRQVEELGGYIERMNTYNGRSYYSSRGARSADMVIRIPKQRLNQFTETVTGECNVLRRSDNVTDVTLTYVDLESRKEALEVEQERLLALLEDADNLEYILTIEERLTNVRYQLESMASQLRTYDNKVDFSTVTLNIQEVEELTPVEEETVWQRVRDGFMDSLESIGDGLTEIMVYCVTHLPYFVIWAAVIVLLIVIIRAINKRPSRHARKKAQAQQAAQAGQQAQAQQTAQAGQQAQAQQAAQAGQQVQAQQAAQAGQQAQAQQAAQAGQQVQAQAPQGSQPESGSANDAKGN